MGQPAARHHVLRMVALIREQGSALQQAVARVERLRALIPQAIAVGYAQREAEEAQESSDQVKRHPAYQRDADAEQAVYEELREELLEKLNRALEGGE